MVCCMLDWQVWCLGDASKALLRLRMKARGKWALTLQKLALGWLCRSLVVVRISLMRSFGFCEAFFWQKYVLRNYLLEIHFFSVFIPFFCSEPKFICKTFEWNRFCDLFLLSRNDGSQVAMIAQVPNFNSFWKPFLNKNHSVCLDVVLFERKHSFDRFKSIIKSLLFWVVRSFHPKIVSPHIISTHIHFISLSFHPTFLPPQIQFTPRSFQSTFISYHNVIIQKRLAF